MSRASLLFAALVVSGWCVDFACAADPVLVGDLRGIEFCTQEICGQAAFAGTFVGTVNGRPAFGYWSAFGNHGPDPANGILGPLPQGDREETQMVGRWNLNVYVLRRFRIRRMGFGGILAGTLRNRGDNNLPVDNFDFEAALFDGPAEFAVNGILRHDTFPPVIDLTIGPAP